MSSDSRSAEEDALYSQELAKVMRVAGLFSDDEDPAGQLLAEGSWTGPDEPLFPAEIRDLLHRDGVADLLIPMNYISARAFHALNRAHLRRLGQIADMSVQDFLNLRNVGTKTVRGLRQGITDWIRRDVSEDGRDDRPEDPPDGEDPFLLSDDLRAKLQRAGVAEAPIPADHLSMRGYNALKRGGYTSLGQLAGLRLGQALDLRNLGVTTVHQIREAVAEWMSDFPIAGPREDSPAETASPREQTPAQPGEIVDLVPEALRARLDLHQAALDTVSVSDVRFGVLRRGSESIGAFLRRPVADLLSEESAAMAAAVVPRLTLLADRIEKPTVLAEELEEILPSSDRAAKIARSRWGWDAEGPKTLEEVGKSFGLTRERIRQIEKKVKDRRLRGMRQYLPTAEALIALLTELGGAVYEDDLGHVAVDRGLVAEPGEVGALLSLAKLGLVSQTQLHRFPVEGDANVISLSDADTVELAGIGARIRRVLSRRGIALIAEVLSELEADRVTATEREVRAQVVRANGLEYLGDERYFWRPDDSNSAFVRRLEKPLVVLGAQTGRALARVLRRGSRRDTYGPSIPTSVLEEALQRSPFFALSEDKWRWIGPIRPIFLGIAEEPLVELLRADGPALSYAEIRARLIDVEGATLAVALSNSPLIERIAQGVYALTGASLLPGDVEEARARAKAQPVTFQLVDTGWERGAFVARWNFYEPRLWSGVLSVPLRAKLKGTWELRSGSQVWQSTVDGGSLWGGIAIWMSGTGVSFPAQVTLRFFMTDRHIEPEIRSL